MHWSTADEEKIFNNLINEVVVVSKSNFSLTQDGKSVVVIRSVYGSCDKSGGSDVSVKYAYLDDGKIKLLTGLGQPNEAFLLEGGSYFISHSERDFDDSFEYRLEPPQPEIYIHYVSRRGGFGIKCTYTAVASSKFHVA